MADRYQTDFMTNLLSRCNCYLLFYCILETALINILIIYSVLPVIMESTTEYCTLYFFTDWDLLQD